jgi:hypothetical protein
MNSRWLVLGFGLLAPCALAGCEQLDDLLEALGRGGGAHPGEPPRPCTAIGCSDQLNVTIRPKDGLFASGTHEVVIAAEGRPVRTCTFSFPIAGGPAAIASGVCPGGDGIFLTVAPLQACTSMTSGGVASQTCTPVPGKFEERLHVPGRSPRVHITQRTTGGATYLDRTVEATYQPVYPNGRACGEVCKQASVEWEF